MTDITPYGPTKPTPAELRAWAADINDGWTTANTLSLYKAARAAYSNKLLAAQNAPRLRGNELVLAFTREDNLKIDIARSKSRIQELQRKTRTGELSKPDSIRELKREFTTLAESTAQLEVVQAQLKEKVSPRDKVAGKTTGKKPQETEQKKPPVVDNKLRYNVGSVSEAYFTSRTEFLLEKAPHFQKL